MLSILIAAASIAAAPPQFVEKPCADAKIAKVARCGTVAVPENRESAKGRTIRLNVVVLPAKSKTEDLPPLFDIDGGPGLPATKNSEFYLIFGDAYRTRRAIVLIDQRGTGGSNPLNCPELDASETEYMEMFPPAAVAACRKELANRADITRYGTREAVADLDAVRAALGYPKIDISALSYGTTVALRYMGTHPDRVRAAVLMGTSPPEAMPPRHHAAAGQRALDLLFADCAQDAACGSAFPSPAKDFDTAIARLAKSGDLKPAIFAEKLRTLMYSPGGARSIPFIVNRAAAGDLAPFYAATRPRERMPYSNGMFLSVTCTEALGLMDFETAAASARTTRFGDYRLVRQREACREWASGKVAADHFAPVAVNSAVLLLSGDLDPVTPPEWSESVARTLPNSRHLIIPGSGHIFDGISGVETCLDPLIIKFYETGDAKTLDASCIGTMRPPPFKVSAAAK